MNRIGIIIAAVVGVLVLGLGITAFVVRQRALAPAADAPTGAVSGNGAETPGPADAALNGDGVAACREAAEGPDRDLCLLTYARGSGDAAACDEVSGVSEELCRRDAATAAAVAAGDLSRCEALQGEARTSCRTAVFAEAGPDGCATFTDAQAECAGCHETVAAEEGAPPAPAGDRDGDGLTDLEEPLYGADPDKADTDGDGFTDSEEVRNGYDPAGPGRGVRVIR